MLNKFRSNSKESKSFAIVVIVQILVVAINFFTGILIIRTLPIEEYGIYVLINALIGIFSVLSDSGVSSGVLIEASQKWKDKSILSSIIFTGFKVRNIFSVIIIAISFPYVYYVMAKSGITFYYGLLIYPVSVFIFWLQMNTSIYAIPLKLCGEIKFLQKIQLSTSAIKSVMSVLVIFCPLSIILILINLFIAFLTLKYTKDKSFLYLDKKKEFSEETRKTIIKTVRKILPINIYYVFSSQIIIGLLAIKGDIKSIAEVGAMGAIALVFTVFTNVFTNYLNPFFSKKESTSDIIKTFYEINILNFLVCIVFLIVFYFTEDYLIMLLGDKFQDKSTELFIFILASCIGYFSSSSLSIFGTKGFIMKPEFYIPINFIGTVLLVFYLNLSTLIDIVYFRLSLSILSILVNIVYNAIVIHKLKRTVA